MVFLVLRHGQSTWNRKSVLAGWNNIHLTDQGINEAKHAALLLKKYKFDYVFTSDLVRTIQTCDIIQRQLEQDFKIISSSALKERNYGILTGKTKDELNKLYGALQVQKWRRSYWGRPPEGESLDDVKHRFGYYFNDNIKPLIKQNKNVLIISHSNALRSFFVHLDIMNHSTVEHFEIDNCKPIRIDIDIKKFWYDNI